MRYKPNSNLEKNDKFVLRRCSHYMVRILQRFQTLDRESIEFIVWLNSNSRDEINTFLRKNLLHYEEINELFDGDGDPDDYGRAINSILMKDRKYKKPFFKLFMNILQKNLALFTYRGSSEMEKKFAYVQKLLGLSDLEIEYCSFVYLVSWRCEIENYFSDHLHSFEPAGEKYALIALGISSHVYQKIRNGKLRSLGIIDISYPRKKEISDDYLPLFTDNLASIRKNKLFRKVPKSDIPLQSHLVDGQKVNLLRALLQKRPTNKATHILLYGQPGTGKTLFTRGLVNALDQAAYEVNIHIKNESINKRAAIMACLNMTNSGEGSIIIVDEADNLLQTDCSWLFRGETQDKGWINQLMDEPGIRMIWIVNSIDWINPSVLRRFAYSIAFKPFNRAQRKHIWKTSIKHHKVKRFFTPQEIDALAIEYDLNAGTIDLTVDKAKEAFPEDRTHFHLALRQSLEAHQALFNHGRQKRKKDRVDINFIEEALAIDTALDPLLNQVEAFDQFLRTTDEKQRVNMNLLFYGPPGTGKSEFARYLAQRFDREILVRRVSDLMSKFVGETEQNIAESFSMAEHEEAVLVIDEAESFLYGRGMAHHSWEISFVNEFLTQMERFRGMLICTTNLLEMLDNASVRRFNRKIRFHYLEGQGKLLLYNKLLAPLLQQPISEDNISELNKINELTPGDFKVVRDRFFFMPQQTLSHQEMIAALEAESRMKKAHRGEKALGFF